jgi:hypothetical protein
MNIRSDFAHSNNLSSHLNLSITDFEINAFLNQDSFRLLKLMSDLVSILDTG